MPTQWEGKFALVTGGAGGIGGATSLAFAREGARVVIADVNTAGGEAFLQIDVSQTAEIETSMTETVARFGRLDCAFNNAGLEADLTPLADSSEVVWDQVIATNLKGVWLCMKYELEQMLTQGAGTIVNNASILGLVSIPLGPAYTASKHGVVGLTKSAALAYAKAGIRVNAVCPGFIHSPMTERVFQEQPELREPMIAGHPLGRIGTADEVASAVIWLSSESASFVTGHTLTVDGGYVAQ